MITDSEDRSMIAELERIIRDEEAKPQPERDTELIDMCVREIAELKGVKAEFSDEEIARRTDSLVNTAKQGQKRKRFIRIAAGIAAAIMLFAGITACSINPVLINWIAEIVRLPFGSSVEQGKVTYYSHGIPTEYDSIEQLIESNEWDIYYPAALPGGVKLDHIEMLNEDDLNVIVFVYNSSDYRFSVQLNQSARKGSAVVTSIEANGLHFDVCLMGDSYVSYSDFDKNSYIIKTKTLDDMILIIGGLRKGSL